MASQYSLTTVFFTERHTHTHTHARSLSLSPSLNLFIQPEPRQPSCSRRAKGSPKAAKFCTTAAHGPACRLWRRKLCCHSITDAGGGVGWRGLAPEPPATRRCSITLSHSPCLSRDRERRGGLARESCWQLWFFSTGELPLESHRSLYYESAPTRNSCICSCWPSCFHRVPLGRQMT